MIYLPPEWRYYIVDTRLIIITFEYDIIAVILSITSLLEFFPYSYLVQESYTNR